MLEGISFNLCQHLHLISACRQIAIDKDRQMRLLTDPRPANYTQADVRR